MAKKKYYAVKKGLTPGIYFSWEDCKKQIDGVTNAVYKGFETIEEAERFVIGYKSKKKMNVGTEEALLSEKVKTPNLLLGMAVAYVDGSYNVSTTEYSCGVVFLFEGKEEHLSEKGVDEEMAQMRNVAGEIMGAKCAMEHAVLLGVKKLTIYHDYQGISSWCLGEWKTNKEGTKAYKKYFDSIRDKLEIEFVKVKGHSGDHYNDLADELAKQAIF